MRANVFKASSFRESSMRFVAWLLVNVARNDLDYTRLADSKTCLSVLTGTNHDYQPFSPFSRLYKSTQEAHTG